MSISCAFSLRAETESASYSASHARCSSVHASCDDGEHALAAYANGYCKAGAVTALLEILAMDTGLQPSAGLAQREAGAAIRPGGLEATRDAGVVGDGSFGRYSEWVPSVDEESSDDEGGPPKTMYEDDGDSSSEEEDSSSEEEEDSDSDG